MDTAEIEGCEINQTTGELTITQHAHSNEYVFVQAVSSYKAKATDQFGLDNTVYGYQLIELR